MLNLSPFGICIIQKHRLIYTNKAFTETFGFSPKQLRDMSPLDIVYAEDREHARKSVEAMLKGETQSFFMFRVMTQQDKIKWITRGAYCVQAATIFFFGLITPSTRVLHWARAIGAVPVGLCGWVNCCN